MPSEQLLPPSRPYPERCTRCEHVNDVPWFAPSPIWNKVVRENGHSEMLCPMCFIQLAEEAGFTPTAWQLAPENLDDAAEIARLERAYVQARDAALKIEHETWDRAIYVANAFGAVGVVHAMGIAREVNTRASVPAVPVGEDVDMEWALRELADGWIASNQCEGPRGFYQNARRVLNLVIKHARCATPAPKHHPGALTLEGEFSAPTARQELDHVLVEARIEDPVGVRLTELELERLSTASEE